MDLRQDFRYGRVGGVPSYQNNGVDDASLEIRPRESALGRTFERPPRNSSGDIRELFDDEATWLHVLLTR